MRIGNTGRLIACVLALSLVILTGCSVTAPPQRPSAVSATSDLTESEQIAGEIMAYLLEVVLGQAGALEKRQAWATRGLDLPLDFDLVYRRMFGPVPLRAELMVLDTNILGLSQVLYHYDPRMNLFKGAREPGSLFPCAELMAIRLLLLQKLHRNEKLSVGALTQYTARFLPGSRDAVDSELAAMQLNAGEFRFLKAIFQSEPAFLRYLRHPFVVSTLKKIGVAEADAATLAADQAANYRRLACPGQSLLKARPRTITILPAMLPMYETVTDTGAIRPSPECAELQAQLEKAIVREFNGDAGVPGDRQLAFYTPNRPVTIHPENADRVIGQICPKADFTVILLGKNVYRSIFIDPHADIYPYKRIIYLDVDDVRYGQIDPEIKAIVTALLPAMAG